MITQFYFSSSQARFPGIRLGPKTFRIHRDDYTKTIAEGIEKHGDRQPAKQC